MPPLATSDVASPARAVGAIAVRTARERVVVARERVATVARKIERVSRKADIHGIVD